MFKEAVEVVEVSGDKARIKFTKKKMCSCCKFSYVCGKPQEELTLDSQGFSLKKGDRIEIGIDEKKSLLAGLITLFVPSVIFVLSLIAFRKAGELPSFFLAILLVCVYYVVVKLILKSKGKNFELKILRKI